MLRLFAMSLAACILHRLFARKTELPSDGVLIAANILTALLFAAGHLPTTADMMGLTPMIVFRCFLLNGGIGLLFILDFPLRKPGLKGILVLIGIALVLLAGILCAAFFLR